MNEPGVKEVSLSDKGQEQVAAQTDSEVHTATLGALGNTLGRWGFYKRMNSCTNTKVLVAGGISELMLLWLRLGDMSPTRFWPI